MNIKEIEKEIIDEFSLFEDWTDKYNYIIELGKSLPTLEEQYKTDQNLINGCQSKVWVTATSEQEKLLLKADSDAIITKGIVALLLRVYDRQNIDDIIQSEPEFIDAIGLKEHLSPTRSNGLTAMLKQIKLYALAFKTKKQQ